jgi:hypothetical protein
MECNRRWKVESKEFEVLIKGGATGVRIIERSHNKRRSIFVQRNELAWMVKTVEEVVDVESHEVFWDQSRAGYPRIIVQKRSNRHGRFLTIEEFEGRRRIGTILIPEGRYGQGWCRIISELREVKAVLWEGRESRAGETEKSLEGKAGRWGLEKARVHGPVEKSKVAPVINKSSASDSDQRNMVTMKNQGQAGCTPDSVDSSDTFCGEKRSEEILEGTKPKGRWVQALLSPASHFAGVACLSNHGQVIKREGAVSDKGVSTFNAKVELYNCREWLRRLRGEVDAGLQRLDGLLKDLDVFGLGQGQSAKGWVPKPKWSHEPRGKTIFIPKASGMGMCSSPAGYKASGLPKSNILSEATLPVGLGLVAGPFGILNGRPSVGVGMGSGPVGYKESGQLAEAIPTVDLGLKEGSFGLQSSGLLIVGQPRVLKKLQMDRQFIWAWRRAHPGVWIRRQASQRRV